MCVNKIDSGVCVCGCMVVFDLSSSAHLYTAFRDMDELPVQYPWQQFGCGLLPVASFLFYLFL